MPTILHTTRHALVLLTIALVASPAMAVFKCEAAGKTVYSDAPCQTSASRMKEIEIQPPAAESSEARQRLQQEKKELERLQSVRRKQEAADQKAMQRQRRAAAARKKKCDAQALRLKWVREDAQQAMGRSREKLQQKLRRAEESYRLSCDAHS
jgi:type IV secretory pathway VirB10-like protein